MTTPRHLHLVNAYDYPQAPVDYAPCDTSLEEALTGEMSELGRKPGLSALSVPLYGLLMFGLGVLAHWAWP